MRTADMFAALDDQEVQSLARKASMLLVRDGWKPNTGTIVDEAIRIVSNGKKFPFAMYYAIKYIIQHPS